MTHDVALLRRGIKPIGETGCLVNVYRIIVPALSHYPYCENKDCVEYYCVVVEGWGMPFILRDFAIHRGRYKSLAEENTFQLAAIGAACSYAFVHEGVSDHAFLSSIKFVKDRPFNVLARSCHVRSSLYRKAFPKIKYAKNHDVPLCLRVPPSEQLRPDWAEYDPNDE